MYAGCDRCLNCKPAVYVPDAAWLANQSDLDGTSEAGERRRDLGRIWSICSIGPFSSGVVRPGIASGATSISTPSATRTRAVPYLPVRGQGSVFSTAMSAATRAIQAMHHHAEGEERRHQLAWATF
jgi:hypothetical protein